MSALLRLPVTAVATQLYGVNATGGIVGKKDGTPIEQLVWNYGNYQEDGHDGFDQGAEPGTTVFPMQGGHVDFAGLGENMPKWCADKWAFIFGPDGWATGNGILVDHSAIVGFPFGTYYAHGRRVLVASGQQVGINTPIMLSGGVPGEPGAGRSGGAHVHTSAVLLDRVYVARNWGRVDPLMYLPEGWSIPTAPGSTGAPATENDNLIAGISGLSK
ncbi:hypothetical protein PTW37_06450 [Arthrobacter agilis]|uniref:M23 family metallopeptidase n=1 Tax=Arthrobacter agilis TaxID=37921 RepID=UPI002365A1F0|nr:hypothetical protein [Arthrobacter agilis]WDF34534.1 hypothetical protein PTW37_06450 [Arthrobacter agilis]